MPVLLVLLTLSLIGIVFLISLNLQHSQDTKRQEGIAIIEAGQGAKTHVSETAASLKQLAASSDTEDRLSSLYKLGASFRSKEELLTFIESSEERSGASGAEQPRELLNAVSDTIAEIGAHPGPLNEAEKQYVQRVIDLYEQFEQILSGFTLETGDKTVEITAQAGGLWVQLGQQLKQALEQAEVGTSGIVSVE